MIFIGSYAASSNSTPGPVYVPASSPRVCAAAFMSVPL